VAVRAARAHNDDSELGWNGAGPVWYPWSSETQGREGLLRISQHARAWRRLRTGLPLVLFVSPLHGRERRHGREDPERHVSLLPGQTAATEGDLLSECRIPGGVLHRSLPEPSEAPLRCQGNGSTGRYCQAGGSGAGGKAQRVT
jgi:hypothetical protein